MPRTPRPRSKAQQEVELPPVMDGDSGLYGVNMRLEAHQVPEGLASFARNMRFREGVAEARLGMVVLPWMNKLVDETVRPWGAIHGVGLFSDPTLFRDFGIIAADGAVYYTRTNNGANQIPLPVGVTLTGPVTFVQAFDVLIMFRGIDQTPLELRDVISGFTEVVQTSMTITRMEGKATVTMGAKHALLDNDVVKVSGADQPEYNGQVEIMKVDDYTFTYAVAGTPVTPATGDLRINDNGTETIPNAVQGLFFQNRLVIPNEQDEVVVSDFNDYTRYRPALQELRINVGSADTLVAVTKFSRTSVVAWKTRSIYAVNNIYGDLTALQQDTLTEEFGLVARDSVAQVGNQLWGLTQQGVMAITQTAQNELQVGRLPVSDSIDPLIKRIHWASVAGAQGVYHDNKYYLAVPLDRGELVKEQELATGISVDQTGEAIVRGLVVGGTYRYIRGSDLHLVHDGVTYDRDADFVATVDSVTITKGPGLSIILTSRLKRVFKNVNNAILVYDVVNGQWAGYDDAEGLTVAKFIVLPYNNEERLFVVTVEGWVFLYEEGYTDQLAVPYTDVFVTGEQETGNTVRVNGGDLITVDMGLGPGNAGLFWTHGWWFALFGQVQAGNSGYDQGLSVPWTAPGTDPRLVPGGVRFYSANGVTPTVEATGGWETIIEVSKRSVQQELLLRAYPNDPLSRKRHEWVGVYLQTWWPKLTLKVETPGVGEVEMVVVDLTRSRVKYTRPFDAADWVNTNINDDHGTPHREDYVLLLGGAEGSDEIHPASGVRPDLHQESHQVTKIHSFGRHAQIRIINTQGRFRLMSALLEGRRTVSPAGKET